jgi:hypothetical protein
VLNHTTVHGCCALLGSSIIVEVSQSFSVQCWVLLYLAFDCDAVEIRNIIPKKSENVT